VAVYAKMLDADGTYDFLLRIVKMSDEKVIVEAPAKNVTLPQTGSSFEFVINLAGLLLPEPGKYEIQLFGNEVYLHRATFNAIHVQGGPQWPQPHKFPHQ
jgi:hypothetical protein